MGLQVRLEDNVFHSDKEINWFPEFIWANSGLKQVMYS